MPNFSNPLVQASNLIRYIGDTVSAKGKPIPELPPIAEIIGAPDEKTASDIAMELHREGSITTSGKPTKFYGGETAFLEVGLSLKGWSQYEELKQKSETAPESLGQDSPQPKAGNPLKNYKYDVTLSFAGEDRRYAKKLVPLIRASGYRVFYDEDESANLWGKNLQEHFEKVYKEDARFCVMFLSKHYAEKPWPKYERRSAQSRAHTETDEYILPVRLDDKQVPGVLPTTGDIDVREMNIDEAVSKIWKSLSYKLNVRSAEKNESAQETGSVQSALTGLDVTPLEKARMYLMEPDFWAPLPGNQGVSADFYCKQFPEFTLRVAAAEDHIDRHQEWTRGEVRTDNNHAGYYDLYYHQTLLNRTHCVGFDDHKKSMVAPKWVPCGSGQTGRSGRFYFYEADSLRYAIQRFYAALEREDHSLTLNIGSAGRTSNEARERWGSFLKIPVLQPGELEAFLSTDECDSSNPSRDKDEQYRLFIRNLLDFEGWRKGTAELASARE